MSELVQLPRRGGKAGSGRVLVVGRPNSGKTTLYNKLAGTHREVGNYPGITVDIDEARVDLGGGEAVLVDLPGTYSLVGRSAEERLAIDAVLDPQRPPDAVLLVVDSTQLGQQLYLVLQVLELGVPCLVALTLSDEAAKVGVDLDLSALGAWLGAPVVAVSGHTGSGIDDLKAKLGAVLRDGAQPRPLELPAAVAAEVESLRGALPEGRRAGAIWALQALEPGEPGGDEAAAARARLEQAGVDLDEAVARARWGAIDEAVPGFLREAGTVQALTDRIDRVLVHPVWGMGAFLLIMMVLFWSLFRWSDPFIGWIEGAFGWLGGAAASTLPAGLVQDFVVEGLIGGVGSVLVFLPQIVLLFLLLSLLEDSGYMARIAYLMDRVMRVAGLHGRAFVPMLSGFACAVPAILATRTLERRRDRLLTMLVIPLTTCAARLPVYTLIIGALFPVAVFGGLVPGLLMTAMYVLGIGMALLAAAVLGRTIFKGEHVPLVLELPPYRLPRWDTVRRSTWSRTKVFLTDAGTLILAASVVLWFLLSFPRVDPAELPPGVPEATAQLEGSFAGQLGKAIEPAVEPLGFDWSIGVGLVGAFAAREVFVATMGIAYGVGGEADENDTTLRARLRERTRADGRPVYTPLVGLSLMVFFALSAQCISTLAVIKRETQSWRWPAFVFAYMTALAWTASFLVYQGGVLLGFQ